MGADGRLDENESQMRYGADMGSVITVCTGHRCAALLEGAAGDSLPSLRSAVRASAQAVLMSTGCVGACAQAPVVALSAGLVSQGWLDLQRTSWLGPVGHQEVRAICDWLADDGAAPLPAELGAAVFVVRIGP